MECTFSERFGVPVDDVFETKCRESKDPERECKNDPLCDMFVESETGDKTCFYKATALQIDDDRNFYGEGKTKYKDCSSMVTTFLESIEETGEADEAQRAITEAMIELVEGKRQKLTIDEEKWAEAEAAANDVSLCEVKQGDYRCDFDVYEPQFKQKGVVKCDEIVEIDGKDESIGLYSALRGLTEEQCLKKCDKDAQCTGVAYWETGLRSQMNTAQFFADMNDPTVMARKDTCTLWVGDDRGEEGVCLENKRKDTEVRMIVLDTTGIVREYDTKAYHKEHLEKALKVGKMEGACKVEANDNEEGLKVGLKYKLSGCAMMVVKYFEGATDEEGQIISERIMEDAVTSQSNRWRYVGDGECRTDSGGFELLREYLSDAKFTVVSGGSNYIMGQELVVVGGDNNAIVVVTEENNGGVVSVSIGSEGSGYVGGEVYALAPMGADDFSSGAKVKMTEMSMALCQKRCGVDDLCTAMAYDEDGDKTSCRLYKGKYAYTKVEAGGRLFKPNDFSPAEPGMCADGEESKFIAKDDLGRGVVVMEAGAEEKCMQRCQDMPGCNAVNMKNNEEGKLVCKTLGTCNVEDATRKSTPWRFATLKEGKGVPVKFPTVQAIDKRTCFKGRSKQKCKSSRDWLRFYKKMVSDCDADSLKICTVEDKKLCKDRNEGNCDGACSWDGQACVYDPEKCPIPGESPIVNPDVATEACRASLQKYMGGRFVGVDGKERGRICPTSEGSPLVAVPSDEVCRRMCVDQPECAFYTYFPGQGGGMGTCAVHREEECRAMISSNYEREQAVSREKVYDLSVDEAIVASAAEQCWAKDVKSDVAASLLITPEFKGDDYVEDSSRCVLLAERDICVKVQTRNDTENCPAAMPCYVGYKGGCVALGPDGSCPSIAIPRENRNEVLRSVKAGRVDCETARSRTECAVIDSGIGEGGLYTLDDYAVVDPVEGIPIETLFLSDENGVESTVNTKEGSDPVLEGELRPMTKRYGHRVVDFADNVKVAGKAVECSMPLDSNTYLMMLSDAEGIDVERGLVEALVSASGDRNISMRKSGERCSSDKDCAPTSTDARICSAALTEEDCAAPCRWDGATCKAEFGKCDLTGEYSCFGRCLADGADPYRSRRENCPIDEATYEASCERKLERIAKAIRPDRHVNGYTRRKRRRPKKRPNGARCGTHAHCREGVCTDGFCGGLTEKRARGEPCSASEPCADGLVCGSSGPCGNRCSDDSGCAAGLVSLTSADFGGLEDLDMFGCVPRTSSAAEAAERCAASLPIDPEEPNVTRCNAFMRYEDRHPGGLSGKTCFYRHMGDEVDEAELEAWEVLREGQSEGQGASGDLYVRNVSQLLRVKKDDDVATEDSAITMRRNARPLTMGASRPVPKGPGCDTEKALLSSILDSLVEDQPADPVMDVTEAIQNSVQVPADGDPCDDDGCCPSSDYVKKGGVCFGLEGAAAGTRCRMKDFRMPTSARARFDLLLEILEGESGCTIADGKLNVLVTSDLHYMCFGFVASNPNEAEMRANGGFRRSLDNRFDILEFVGFEQMDKASQTQLLEGVISTVMESCPTPEDRFATRMNNQTVAPVGKGPSPALLVAMAVLGAALGVAVAMKKVSPKLLVLYAALCTAGGMASTVL